MRPGILLDRDGTVNVDYHYVGHPERIQLIPGAADAIRRFNQHGIPVAIVTNQSGVARGFYPESNVNEVHEHISRELALHGAHVDLFLYSPYHPDGTVKEYAVYSDCSKPNAGMAHKAAKLLDLDLTRSIVVGDRISDMQMAWLISAYGIYLGAEPLPFYMFGPKSMRRIRHFDSLADAAGYIIERITKVSQSEFPTIHYGSILGFFEHYRDEIVGITERIDRNKIADAADMIAHTYSAGAAVFVAGNGGSAAISNHFECDHVRQATLNSERLISVNSLSSNQALMTMIANDIGYDAVFSYQIERRGLPGDTLIVFSASGNSANIVRAVQAAKEQAMNTIAVVGFDGGKVAGMTDVTIHIPISNYGVVEDIMSMIMHVLAQFIRQSAMEDHEIQSAVF